MTDCEETTHFHREFFLDTETRHGVQDIVTLKFTNGKASGLYDAHSSHHYTGHKDDRQVDQRELVDVVVRVELAVIIREIFLHEARCVSHAITLITPE
jgi:hypothetical protein